MIDVYAVLGPIGANGIYISVLWEGHVIAGDRPFGKDDVESESMVDIRLGEIGQDRPGTIVYKG